MNTAPTTGTRTTINAGGHNIIRVSGGGRFFYVWRVDDVIVRADVTTAEQNVVRDFMDAVVLRS